MTRKRMLVAGAVAVLALGVGMGGGVAIAQDGPDQTWPPAGHHGDVDMDGRHDQMRTQMPEELRDQCDAQHAEMGDGAMGDQMGDGPMGGRMVAGGMGGGPTGDHANAGPGMARHRT